MGELSKGQFCSYKLIQERADELEFSVIKSQIVSERRIRDFLSVKYNYSEVEQELLIMHLKVQKRVEICQITIKDETTKEEIDYRAIFSTKNVGANEAQNLKIVELELNLYTLSDAIDSLDCFKEIIQDKVKLFISQHDKERAKDMLTQIVYCEEVWVNLARSITIIEEQLSAFNDISEVTLQLLIRRTRRDIFFFEKCRNYLTVVLNNCEIPDDYNIEEIPELPQWIRKVEIDFSDIESEVNILMTEKSVEEYNDVIEAFLHKVKLDIKLRDTLNCPRPTTGLCELRESTPNSYMGTIAKFQEFFGLDSNGDPIGQVDAAVDDLFNVNELRYEDPESPSVRKSVLVAFEGSDSENGI